MKPGLVRWGEGNRDPRGRPGTGSGRRLSGSDSPATLLEGYKWGWSCLGTCRVLHTLTSSPWSLTSNRTSSPLPGSYNGMGAPMGEGALSGAGLSLWKRVRLSRVGTGQRYEQG